MVVLWLTGCGGHVHHRVREGETLYAIGWRYGQDYRRIAEWNDIPPPYVIHSGEILRVAPPVEPWWQQRERAWRGDGGQMQAKADTGPAQPQRGRRPDAVKKEPISIEPPEDSEDQKVTWRWPTRGQLVARFSPRPPLNKGIDIGGAYRQEIVAAAPGKVVYSGNGLIGYGNLVIIKHNRTYLSAYAHNDSLMVQEGDAVEAGQQIATMGRSGSERPVLHFEIRRNGKPVDPLVFLERQGY